MALNHQYNSKYVLNAKNGGEPINDAVSYGVRVIEANVNEGETYWKIIGVHHLLPQENVGKHNVYFEALDENGNRIPSPFLHLGWTWEGRQPHERVSPLKLDKPHFEEAGNLQMHYGQKIAAWALGTSPSGQDKSDRVENLHTAHADELYNGKAYNSIGHHSFYVVFQRTRKEGASDGVISGQVDRGQGHRIRLVKNNQTVSQQEIGNDAAFRFDNLADGVYRLEVVNTGINQDFIKIDSSSKNQVVNLALPLPTQSIIRGRITNGQDKKLLLVLNNNIVEQRPLPASGDYAFQDLGAGTYSVVVFETNVRRDNIVLDGTNQTEVNLTVPKQDTGTTPPVDTNQKVLNHYVLFGPPNTRGRQTNLLLAVDYVLQFSSTVGFNLAEAKKAQQVTIIGEGITPAQVQELKDAGCQVDVISGDSYAIEAELISRLNAGRAIG
ncbi:MAG: hypothetical protein R3264_05285 [Anaerolineae bacterium]|nr:hypothetical protein [Anaerolineae bacterium]